MLQVQEPYIQNALDVAKSCMHVLFDFGLLRDNDPLLLFFFCSEVVRCSYISLQRMNTDFISACQLWFFTQHEQHRSIFLHL